MSSDGSTSKRVVIDLQTEKARQELKELEKITATLKKQRIDATAAGDQNKLKQVNIAIAEANTKMKTLRTSAQNVDYVMSNLSTAGLKEINATIKSINARLRSGDVERNSTEWRTLNQHLKACNTELSAIKSESKASESIFSQIGNGVNKYAASVASAVAAVTGLSMTIKKCTSDYAQMDDVMTNTTKYTGQTKEEVEEMNEDFKKMDTRTSREQLNDLAGVAGRLGITGKQAIEEFVNGADTINVALGDDLGEGAVDKIGKLAQMFGEDKTKGLRGAMLATGSAVNDLAQTSSANAGYIVDFTADLSGVGVQANMAQSQIMGLASTLDQNMQEESTASTVFSQLITKMYQEPARFAKIAGMQVKDFTNLMKTDANGGLIMFLESMKSRGGFDAMAPLFQEMKLDGTRAVGVLSAVATHIDQVKVAQQTAASSYAAGTSVVKEFNTQNSSVQAQLDKAKKKFQDLSIELGEKLMPIAKYAISTTSAGVKILSALVSFISKYKTTIVVLSACIAALTLVEEGHIIKQKAIDFWNNVIASSSKKLWTVLAAHPYVAIAAAVAAVVAVIIDLNREESDLTRKQKLLNDIKTKAAEKMSDEKNKIDLLVAAARDETMSLSERHKAVNELNKMIPNYNAKLDDTTGKYKENKKALDDYLVSLEKKYELEGAKEQLAEIGKRIADAKVKIKKAQDDLTSATDLATRDKKGGGLRLAPSQAETEFHNVNISNAQDNIKKGNHELKKAEDDKKTIFEVYGDDLKKDAIKGIVPSSPPDPPTHSGGTGGSDVEDKYDAAIKAAEEAYKKEKLELSKSLQQKQITQNQYDDESYKKNINFLSKKIKIEKQFAKSSVDTEQEMTNAIMSEADRRTKHQETEMNESLRQKDLSYDAEQMSLKRNLIDKKISQDEYDQAMKDAEKKYHQDRLDIIKKYGGDEVAEHKALLDIDYNNFIQNQQKEAKDKEKKSNEYQKKYDKSNNISEKSAINESMYQNGLETFEEYEQKKVDIAQQKADQRKQIEQALQDGISNILSSATSYFSAASQAEQAEVSAKYDKEIEAAGSNTKKGKKLEEKKQKELAVIKSKYNKKAMVIEVAQAIAQTALNAISAYGAMAKIPVIGPALGIAAAAMATAAGMIQIATIKKQHQAQESGYYSGGFTKGSQYKEEAGVVHQGEFVANHQAVNNPNVLPILRFINQAQRNNTVGRLTSQDIAHNLGGSAAPVVAPIVNIENNSAEVVQSVSEMKTATQRLNEHLDNGIVAVVSIDGRDGIAQKMKEYNRLLKNK